MHRYGSLGRRALRLGLTVGLAATFLGAMGGVLVTPAASQIAPEHRVMAADHAAPFAGGVITLGVGAAIGPVPAIGWRQVNAVQLAVDQVNASGGITIAGAAYTLTLVVADDGCSPAQAEAAAQELLEVGSLAVVGYTCSEASRAASPLHAAAGVAMISPSSTEAFVTEAGHTTTFRVTSRDDRNAERMPAFLGEHMHMKRAAIVALGGFYGNWATDTVSRTFTGAGSEITGVYQVAATSDFTDVLAAIQPDQPDVIFYADVDANHAGLLSRVAHGLGMTETAIAWTTFTDDEGVLATYAVAAGAAAEGDHAAMFYRRPQDMPGYDTFNTAYVAAGFPDQGDRAAAEGAFAYDAATVIIAAIRSCQSLEPAAIRDAIAATRDFSGVVGLYSGFDGKGDVIPQWGWMERYTDGRWVSLDPARLCLPLLLNGSG